MAPKKKSNNGYMAFMLELATKMGRADAEKEAARIWPSMTLAERAPYQPKRTNMMNEMREQIDNMHIYEKTPHKEMFRDIQAQLSSIRYNEGIYNEYFQILHINQFFTTTRNVCYPAEIGIVRFNLKDGVTDENVYHSIIKPGEFPLGYKATAKAKSDNVHKLPYLDVLPDNKEEIMHNVYSFLSETAKLNGKRNELPPLYVRECFREEVTLVLNQMADKYDYDTSQLRIYNLTLLLCQLRNDVRNKAAWPTNRETNNELDADVFDFTFEIACEFHRTVNAPLHCSRSQVVRMAYVICDSCCPDLKITLIPGRHIPLNAGAEPAREDSKSPVRDIGAESASSAIGDTSEHKTSSKTDPDDFKCCVPSSPSPGCSSANSFRDPSDSHDKAAPFRGRGRGSFRHRFIG